MTFEERATVALGSVILLISQTMDTAKNRRKHCDGQMLINEQAANFDPGEVTPFHMACS